MKKLFAAMALAWVPACGPGGAVPLHTNLNFNVDVPSLPAVLVDLDGRWVLAGGDGSRSCLVVQESRVSIIDLTCSSDGRGFVAGITNSPVISRAGDVISMTVTYRPSNQVDLQARLTFNGSLQVDGSFIGTRRDEILLDKNGPTLSPAILSRQ